MSVWETMKGNCEKGRDKDYEDAEKKTRTHTKRVREKEDEGQ